VNTSELLTWLCKNYEEHVQCWQASDGTLMACIKTLGMAPVGIRVTDDSVIISDRGTTLELLAKDIERKLTPADKRLLLRTCLPVAVRLRNGELVFEGWFDDILTGIILIAMASEQLTAGVELLKRIAARQRRARTKSKARKR
jgi:hypothetical protein